MAPAPPRTDASLMPTPRHRAVIKARTKANTKVKTMTKPVGMAITQVAEHLGITTHVLRIWEQRYGWPKPERNPKGYRSYPRTLVAILERVRDELQHGKAIGDLMRDPWWQEVFETGELPKPSPRAPVEPPWSSLPVPASPLGRDVRTRLQQALVAADARMARWAQAMGEQLRPEERESAVKAVLRMWHQYRPVEA